MLKEIKSNKPYNFDVYLLIASVKAAKIQPYFSNRFVPGKENFNRVWVDEPKSEDQLIANSIYKFIINLPLIAILDLHSFTAKNTSPHCIICYDNNETINISKKLASTIFFMDMSYGALIDKLGKKFPSVTVECGTNLTREADDSAFDVIQRFFTETKVKEGVNHDMTNKIYSGVFNVKVNKDTKIIWSDKNENNYDLVLRKDVESLNLKEIEAQTFFGWSKSLDCFIIRNKEGIVKPNKIFILKDNKLYIKSKAVPSLLAPSEFIIKESGFYLFEDTILI